MPGFLVDMSTTMTCPHGGKVTFLPSAPPVVLLNGKAVLTSGDTMTVVLCTATPQCATVKWANVGQVTINGKPVLLQAPPIPPGPGNATCFGSATPVPPVVVATQPFVAGT